MLAKKTRSVGHERIVVSSNVLPNEDTFHNEQHAMYVNYTMRYMVTTSECYCDQLNVPDVIHGIPL